MPGLQWMGGWGAGFRWPWAHLGTAWYAGFTLSLIGCWFLGRHRGSILTLLAWLSRVGAGISLGLIVVMLILQTFCVWCAATHIAGLTLWFLLAHNGTSSNERSGRHGVVARVIAPMLAFGVLFAAATAWLAMFERSHASAIDAAARAEEAAMAEAAAARRAADAPAEVPTTDVTSRDPLAGRWTMGPPGAAVSIVVFSDYECPDCKRIEAEVDAVLSRGDVSVTARHFPLCAECNPEVPKSLHPDACRRAALAEAAGSLGGQSAFRAAHAALFALQRPRGEAAPAPPSDAVAAVAAATGLDPAVLTARAGEAATNDAIAGDIRDALSLGVTYTPMVFVNGREWKWYQTRGRLVDLVDRVITQSLPAVAPVSALEKMVDEWRTAKSIGELAAETPAFLLLRAEDRAAAVPQVRVWLDYTVPGSAVLDRHLRELAAAGVPFDLWVYQFPASSQCNDMMGLPTGRPESCVGSLAACAAGIVGGEAAFRGTHDWLLAHAEGISLAGISKLWDGLPGGRRDALAAFSDGRAREVVLRQAEAIYRRAAVTAVPILVVNGRVVPRWEHPGAPARELLGAILAEAAKELESSSQAGEVAKP